MVGRLGASRNMTLVFLFLISSLDAPKMAFLNMKEFRDK
jgi:hypothetical protein